MAKTPAQKAAKWNRGFQGSVDDAILAQASTVDKAKENMLRSRESILAELTKAFAADGSWVSGVNNGFTQAGMAVPYAERMNQIKVTGLTPSQIQSVETVMAVRDNIESNLLLVKAKLDNAVSGKAQFKAGIKALNAELKNLVTNMCLISVSSGIGTSTNVDGMIDELTNNITNTVVAKYLETKP